MSEVWTKWEGQVISGVFPLRRFLSGSDHSGVFLTEYKAQNLANAAIKLIRANPTQTQSQVSQWTTAAALSHPRLVRLLEVGRCQLGGLPFLFVVMEYADQTLSQILLKRALTSDEVREMLLPILDALAFLHGRNLVLGQLKPSNILVVNDQLKLASDTVRPAGESAATSAESAVYGAPEAKDGNFSIAGDLWSLGLTLVEALTQQPTLWPDSQSETEFFPGAIPPTLERIIRQCLNRSPADRPTVGELQAELKPAAELTVPSVPQPTVSAPQPVSAPPPPVSVPPPPVSVPPPPVAAPPPVSVPRPPVAVPPPPVSVPRPAVAVPKPVDSPPKVLKRMPERATPPENSPKLRWLVPAIALLFILVAAVQVGVRLLRSQYASKQVVPSTAVADSGASQSVAPEDSGPRSAERPVQPSANKSASVLHEEIPDVSRHALDTIRGRIKVSVRVTVDRSGNVVDESLETRGSSYYFARLSIQASRKWKFAPADNQAYRKWLLRFEFSRGGVTGHAAGPKS
jgi:serine/threonine protein kinase